MLPIASGRSTDLLIDGLGVHLDKAVRLGDKTECVSYALVTLKTRSIWVILKNPESFCDFYWT